MCSVRDLERAQNRRLEGPLHLTSLLLTCYCNYYCCSNYIIEEVVKTRGDAIERNQRVPGSHDEVEEIILWQ